MKKLLSILLVLVLAVSACVMTTSAEATAPTLQVPGGSFSMNNAIDYNIYAISSAAKDDTEVLVWIGEKEEYTVDTADDVITESKKSGQYYIYTFAGIAAKKMADVFYCAAHTVVDGVDYYSNVKSFSFTRYAKSIMEGDDAAMADLAYAALEYGAAAQIAFDYNTDLLANTPLYTVTVEGGTASTDMVYEGKEVTITAPETDAEGKAFTGWIGSDGSTYADATAVVIVTEDVTFTATYGAGYQVESDGAEGFIITGYIGEKTRLVIPAEINGAPVTGIAAGAFVDQATEITIADDIAIEDGAIAADIVINGYAGSAAETYTVNNGNDFQAILAPVAMRIGTGGGKEMLSVFANLHDQYASNVDGHYDNYDGWTMTNDAGETVAHNAVDWFLGFWANPTGTAARYYVSTHNKKYANQGGFRYQCKLQDTAYAGVPCDFSIFGTVELTFKFKDAAAVEGKNINIITSDTTHGWNINEGNVVSTWHSYGALTDGEYTTISIPAADAFGANLEKVAFFHILFQSAEVDTSAIAAGSYNAETLDSTAPFALQSIQLTSELLIEK